MELLTSLFYVAMFLSAFFGILFIKKSNKVQNFVAWIPLSFILLICFDAFIAGIVGLISIPINIFSTAIINAILSVVLCFFIFNKKAKQSYTFVLFDAVALCFLGFLAAFCGMLQFGSNLDLGYATSDASIHLMNALRIVNSQEVSSMYLVRYFIAMMIEVVSPFMQVTAGYRVFIVCDIFFLFLSGAMFYSLVRRWASSLSVQIVILGLTVLYMLGYPLNNMVFGFSYLGAGVTVVAALIFVMGSFFHEDIHFWWALSTAMLLLFGLVISYSLFCPPVYFAVFLFLVFHLKEKGRFFTSKNIGTLLFLFLPPAILGFIYAYLGIFGSTVSVSGAIGTEGFVYRDLYSNFIIIAPFSVFAIFSFTRDRKRSLELILIFTLLFTMFLSLGLGLLGAISSYYFYKFYYLLWLLMFVFAAIGLAALLEKGVRVLVYSYCAVWISVMLLAVGGIDQKLHDKNILLNPQVKSWSYLDVYSFNLGQMKSGKTFPDETLELFNLAFAYAQEGSVVPLVSDWEQLYWYQAITNQEMGDYHSWVVAFDDYAQSLLRCEYVAVLADSEAEAMTENLFDGMDVIFRNSSGYIVKVG